VNCQLGFESDELVDKVLDILLWELFILKLFLIFV
jgi:hypothetical protein